jgi:hypothetical protein
MLLPPFSFKVLGNVKEPVDQSVLLRYRYLFGLSSRSKGHTVDLFTAHPAQKEASGLRSSARKPWPGDGASHQFLVEANRPDAFIQKHGSQTHFLKRTGNKDTMNFTDMAGLPLAPGKKHGADDPSFVNFQRQEKTTSRIIVVV